MKLKTNLLAWVAAFSLNLNAAVPPVEQLVPADALAVITVPDWVKAQTSCAASPAGQLWQDPEIKAFKEKFLHRFQDGVIAPLDKELGVKLADYAELLQGQVTVAMSFKAGEGSEDPAVGWCLLIDTKDKSELLKKQLGDLKKKWGDAGKQVKNDKIRDVEFTTLVFTGEDVSSLLKKAFPAGADKEEAGEKSTNQVELVIGQSESLLLVGDQRKELEKILARQAGGQVPPLGELAEYQSSQAMFREALGYGWVNLKPVFSFLNQKMAQAGAAGPANPLAPKPEKVFSALGLDGLKTVSFCLASSAEGDLGQIFLNIPEAGRKGLFKLLAFEPKSANPPPFVPADVVKFDRWRLDGQKGWETLKGILSEISPQLSGLLQMGLAAAGGDKGSSFDLEKSLIGNLGDDVITYQKNPKEINSETLNSPPTLYLIGSANAETLAQALRAGSGLVAPSTQLKEREFLGRKIVSLPMPALPNSGGEKDKMLSFAASGGYVALSTEDAMIEEYLRGADTKAKSLADLSGLKEAAQKIGGMDTGLWGYENQGESVRVLIEALKRDSSAFEKLFDLSPLGKNADAGKDNEGLKSWLDFSLLPAYEKIAKYFSFNVFSGIIKPEGLSLKLYYPAPPGLKK